MIKVDVTLEDLHLSAEYRDLGKFGKPDFKWDVTLTNSDLAKKDRRFWSNNEMAAVLTLGVTEAGEDPIEGIDAKKLYEIGERALEGLVPGLRPIP